MSLAMHKIQEIPHIQESGQNEPVCDTQVVILSGSQFDSKCIPHHYTLSIWKFIVNIFIILGVHVKWGYGTWSGCALCLHACESVTQHRVIICPTNSTTGSIHSLTSCIRHSRFFYPHLAVHKDTWTWCVEVNFALTVGLHIIMMFVSIDPHPSDQ